MSWIDDIKLAKVLINGTELGRYFGLNFLGLGVKAEDTQTGAAVSLYEPVNSWLWYLGQSPAVAAERWISSWGSLLASYVGKLAYGTSLSKISWTSTGVVTDGLTVKLYVNGAHVPAADLVISPGAGPNYQVSKTFTLPTFRPHTLGVSVTQGGVTAEAINAVIEVS